MWWHKHNPASYSFKGCWRAWQGSELFYFSVLRLFSLGIISVVLMRSLGVSMVSCSSLFSHTDFNSTLQGNGSSWCLEQEGSLVADIYGKNSRAETHLSELTKYGLIILHLLHTLQRGLRLTFERGGCFSPGCSPDWQDTMAVKRISTLCV